MHESTVENVSMFEYNAVWENTVRARFHPAGKKIGAAAVRESVRSAESVRLRNENIKKHRENKEKGRKRSRVPESEVQSAPARAAGFRGNGTLTYHFYAQDPGKSAARSARDSRYRALSPRGRRRY